MNIQKILMAEKPSLGFEFLRTIDALPPYLKALETTHQRLDYHPEGHVFNHTMLVIDVAALTKHKTDHPYVCMWSCLLHDIWKTCCNYKKKVHAHGHNEAGVEVFKQVDIITAKKERRIYFYNDYVSYAFDEYGQKS